MKTKIIIPLALLALASLSGRAATPLGTEFTYQGRLTVGTNVANGIYDLRFALFDALSGPGQVGPTLTSSLTGVTNGSFTVTLDFGPGRFTGDARWLEIGVRTNGSVAAYTTLSPRQPLTPTPNAQYATLAGNVAGPVPDARLSANVALRSGGNAFTGTQTMAENLFLSGNQNFGQQTRQMLNLWDTRYGIGIQSYTLYFRTDNADNAGGFAWYRGGVHSNGPQDPGAGGQKLMSLTADGLLVNGSLYGDHSSGGFGSAGGRREPARLCLGITPLPTDGPAVSMAAFSLTTTSASARFNRAHA